MSIIKVENVVKEYRLGALQSIRDRLKNINATLSGRPAAVRKDFKAIDGANFEVSEGEVVGIIGHNGAGKSTLLKLLSRITSPTTGTITVAGKIAPLIEVGAGFVGDLTGRENIYLNAAILGIPRKQIQKRLDEIISFAELEEFIDTPVKRYSSGMTVRLGFSIATSVTAQILIVDEVLAVGDLAFQQKCIERMERLIKREGRTVLIVGHNIRQLERLCTRVMLLDHGKITADGTPADVCGRFFRESQERTFDRSLGQSIDLTAVQSSGSVHIRRLDLLNSHGKVVDGTALHEPLTVRVHLTTERPIPKAEVVIGLHTPDFVHVTSVSNLASGATGNLETGDHIITCHLHSLPLRPFTYGLRLAVLDSYRHMLWYAENIVPVVIRAGSHDITKLPEVGLIDVPATWDFAIENAPPAQLTGTHP